MGYNFFDICKEVVISACQFYINERGFHNLMSHKHLFCLEVLNTLDQLKKYLCITSKKYLVYCVTVSGWDIFL